MSQRSSKYPCPAINQFVAGTPSYTRILGGKRNYWYTYIITGTVTVAGGALTAALNGGQIGAMFQYLGIDENGYRAAEIDVRKAIFLTGVTGAAVAPDIVLPPTAANGVYNLRTTIRLPFAWPLGVNPTETCHVERDPSQQTNAYVQPWATGVATALGRIATGPGTAAITNLNVQVIQEFDDEAITAPPIFVPRYREQSFAVAATNADEAIYIRSAVPLRGLILGQDTATLGSQTDIIVGMAHRDSLRDYVGPRQAPYQALVSSEAQSYGGIFPTGRSLATDPAGPLSTSPFYFQNYQSLGRLSRIWNPANGGQDLRWELSVAPSAVVGAGASSVTTTVIELLKIANRTTDAAFPY